LNEKQNGGLNNYVSAELPGVCFQKAESKVFFEPGGSGDNRDPASCIYQSGDAEILLIFKGGGFDPPNHTRFSNVHWQAPG